MRLGLRTRLLATVVGSMVLLFVLVMVGVRTTVSNDLNALARGQVDGGADAFTANVATRVDETRSIIASAAAQDNLSHAVSIGDRASLRPIVLGLQQPNGFSFVSIVDTHGNVIVRGNGLDAGRIDDPALRAALRDQVVSGTIVLDNAELQGEYLATEVAPFTSAVAIAAAAPISANGKIVGAIYGGTVLSGESKLVDSVSRFSGGTAAVLLGNRISASSIVQKDGARFTDVPVSAAAAVLRDGSQFIGLDSENGGNYAVRIDPLKDISGHTIGALWFGIPLERIDAITTNALRSVVLWGIVGLVVAIAIAVLLAERIAGAVTRRSHQIGESAKELGVLVVGSEVSVDHVVQTREKLESVEDLLARAAPGTPSETERLRVLTAEARSDVIVIDTLTNELNGRMKRAVLQVAQLNEVAEALTDLVDGRRPSLRN